VEGGFVLGPRALGDYGHIEKPPPKGERISFRLLAFAVFDGYIKDKGGAAAMVVTEEQKKTIEKIIGQLDCRKDFRCYKSGFEDLCKAKDIGLESHLQCLEEAPFKCPFSVHFGRSYFCNCPLRVYIAKTLEKPA